ncbi:hypothetical protein D3C79_1024320 [compost metagenome]
MDISYNYSPGLQQFNISIITNFLHVRKVHSRLCAHDKSKAPKVQGKFLQKKSTLKPFRFQCALYKDYYAFTVSKAFATFFTRSTTRAE